MFRRGLRAGIASAAVEGSAPPFALGGKGRFTPRPVFRTDLMRTAGTRFPGGLLRGQARDPLGGIAGPGRESFPRPCYAPPRMVPRSGRSTRAPLAGARSIAASLLIVLLVAPPARLEAAEPQMIEIVTDLPKSLDQRASIIPFRLTVKNNSEDLLVFERVRSLTSGADLVVSFVEDVPRESKRPISLRDRLNLFLPRSTREFSGSLRLPPGDHVLSFEVVVAVHDEGFLRDHIRTVTGRSLPAQTTEGLSLARALDPEMEYFVSPGADAAKKTIARALHHAIAIRPNATVEKLRSRIQIVDFVDALPMLGLAVRNETSTYLFDHDVLTRIGFVSLGALKRMSEAFSRKEPILIFVMRPGPGRSLERAFGAQLSLPKSEIPIAATDDMTYGLLRFPLSLDSVRDLFRAIDEDGSTLSETGSGKLIVFSR